MRERVRHFPIQRKLRLVVLATCSAALCVASSALFALQFYSFQREFRRDLVAVAEIIAANSIAALSFNDEEAARENLGSLKAKPQITGAALVLADGRPLAHIGRVKVPGTHGTPLSLGFHEAGDDIIYVQPVALGSERIGTLYLHADYTGQANKLHRLYASILVGVLFISFLVAVLVSWRLERVILGPIQNLAETARQVSSKNDYSVRANKIVDDEVGSFTDSFNHMLEQIQARDTALLHEIAERKRTEEALQHTQRQLIETSHQAGMAEIATGVLHNVGNVLNSVNVSATLIAERLNRAGTENLVRAAALLQEKNGEIGDFLTNDPKGRILPKYLAEVSRHLDDERLSARQEVELLTRNIEHIKDIVAMQQTYARVSSTIEAMPIEQLLDEVLRLNGDSFARDGITVAKSLSQVPPVAVDKHKALQILINVLHNAQHAMEGQENKQITIRTGVEDETMVFISIADTGVGIAPENLTRIFSHGFTTRKNGHGFGLHTAALAARQMAGRLSVKSDGPSHGATFTLSLPRASSSSIS